MKFKIGDYVLVRGAHLGVIIATDPDSYYRYKVETVEGTDWFAEALLTAQEPPKAPITSDVTNPSHYQVFPGLESIEVIARSMTVDEFRGFCMGNTLKYRLRAGKKSDLANVEKDLQKAAFYKELFEKHKGECRC